MFNIKPISWPTIVLFRVYCWFAIVVVVIDVGRSEEFTSIIDNEFSFKAIIESYDETGRNIVERTQSTEFYSSEYSRGIVKLLGSNNRPIEYYYDGDLNGTFLEVIPDENLCISSSQYDLHLKLYHSLIFPVINDICMAVCPECKNNQFNWKHLIGTAKILALVQMLRPKFGRPLRISTQDDSHRAVYHTANIGIGEDSIELFVHYDRVLDATSKLSDQIQPQFVRLNYTTHGGYSHTIGLTFYQFNLLIDNDDNEQIQRPLSFPTGMYCSRAIGESLGDKKQVQVQMIQDMFMHIERFSFTAKVESSAVKIYYAFDLPAKLMRKDFYIEGVRSKTIYDMKTKLKYNKITSLDSPTQTISECVVDTMENRLLPTVDSNEKFINFEQLVYLGRARINSIDSLIFEEYSTRHDSSGVQFWLKPPVWATQDRALNSSFRADETRGGHSYITYYFATGLGNSSVAYGEQTIGPLLQIEITIRDAISRIVWQQRMTISEFIVGRLSESDPELNPMQIFSLESMNCRFWHEKRGKVRAVLESKTYLSPSLLDSNERNEILIRTLDREYKIPRTQLDQLSSSIKTTSEGDKFAIELEFTISQNLLDEQLNLIECVYLGRGKPIVYDSPEFKYYTGIATFEDCMWLAHQYSLNINGDEVLFVFTERLKCIVDRLYRYDSPSGIGSSNESLSLNYYPYEQGSNTNNRKIFTIRNTFKKWPVSSPSDGMYFFQIGSHKLIGQSVELKLPGAKKESINLKFSKVSLSGYLARVFYENFEPMKRITDLSWSQLDAIGNKLNKLIALPVKSLYPLRLESQMNEAYCRSHCLTDLSCNSYSYCDRLDAHRESQCLLSSIDVSKTIVMKQLENLKDNLMRTWSNERNRHRVRKAKIMFDEGSLQQPEIEVVLDRTCSISSKSHSDLFKRAYPVKVEGSMIESIDKAIKSKDECAKKCFSKNIDCLMKLTDLKQGKTDNQPLTWESISNLARDHMRDFCTGFLYTDEHISVLNGSACLLSASQGVTDNQSQGRKTTGALIGEAIESISMYQHNLVYSDLFWQLPGLRLRDSGEFEEIIRADNNHEKLLELHSLGLNSQNKLPIDNVQLCARACILQLHGPKPMCSSFDFVHEQIGSTLIKYCLLNSQSFHDLQQRGQILDQQVLHQDHDNVTFWHFEPQDTALQTSGFHRISEVGNDARGNAVKNYHLSALISLSFVLKLVGLVSGLIIGVKFTSHILDVPETVDESLTPGGKTARLIHRLSGVSLRSNLREVEVQMS